MKTLCIEVQRNGSKSFITKNRMRAEVTAEFYVRVAPTTEAVSIAAQTLGNRTLEPDHLKELVHEQVLLNDQALVFYFPMFARLLRQLQL